MATPIEHCREFIESWRPASMFPSEIAWLVENVERAGCDLLVECGRHEGVSTEVLASYFWGSGTSLISIDFEEDRRRTRRSRERLRQYDVEFVSGDVHVEVPRILRRAAGKKVAVLQDAAKGWEGLATLLAAAVSRNVGLVAQHNLHLGHVTRTIFQKLSPGPCFLEGSQDHGRFASLLAEERDALATKNPNRPLDHTSLGVMLTDAGQKRHLEASFTVLKPIFDPWNPAPVVSAWEHDDFGYVDRLRRRVRFTPARFKPR